MADLQDINYALISALYANNGGLYSDVYFPIIKYTVVQLFNKKSMADEKAFYTAQDVHDFIDEKFKISIPTIVITKSLEKIEKTKKNFVELSLMEHGNSFQIKKIWDSQEFDALAEREKQFSNGLENIEKDYKRFLEENGTYDDGVSYLQFIADNTQEVLGYFQNSDTSIIDEKYATVIFFLEYLHKTPSKKEEFYIADQLFWASIIAGFLKSDKPSVDASDDGSVKEYFLDTSILLGMLKLSSAQKEIYAEEIKEIIKASGGAMKVHPMTLEEIKNILSSVESSGQPDSGTDIAEAWVNHRLSITKLAQTRFNLHSLLDKQGVQLFPIIGAEACRRITASYKGKKVVDELARERSMKPRSYSQDNFREIHDLFMDDYIKERRKEKTIPGDVVFVTANRDLISFTRRMHPEVNYMMSTGRVILDLWMHSVKPANISGCALTETMARCLDQHNLRVRNKIVEVSKFFNENKGNFDPQVYQDFIKKLYRRAKNVIMTVETDPDEQNTLNDLTVQQILDAIKADQEYSDKRVDEVEANKKELKERLAKETREKESLEERNRINEEHIGTLTQENQELLKKVTAVQEDLSSKEKAIKEQSTGRKAAEETIALYKKRDELKTQLEEIEVELAPMETRRQKSFSSAWPVCALVIGILFFLVAIAGVIYALCIKEYKLIAIGAVPATIGGIFVGRFFSLKDKKEARMQEAYSRWEQRPENIKYGVLSNRRIDIKKQIEEISDQLNK